MPNIASYTYIVIYCPMMHKFFTTLLSIFCLAYLVVFPVAAQEAGAISSDVTKQAASNLVQQLRVFPQEKLYVHTDKPYYAAGDRIWFRAYLVHSALHQPLNISRTAYVELLDAKQQLVKRVKVSVVDLPFLFSQMDLAPELKEGWYTLRAYTNYMRNLDESLFFHKQIFIGNKLISNSRQNEIKADRAVSENQSVALNPVANVVETPTALKPDTNIVENPFDIRFFPEGGTLVAGNKQMLGFKAIGLDGRGIGVSGKIVDERGNLITEFASNTLGMGRCEFQASAGKSYAAQTKDSAGRLVTIQLPAVSTTAVSLQVRQKKDLIELSVLTPSGKPLAETLYIIGCLRGIPVFQGKLTSDNASIKVPSLTLGSGVIQVFLINSSMDILSQRLLYHQSNDLAQVDVKTNKAVFGKRDSVFTELTVRDESGNPLKGTFSVSITDDNDFKWNPSELDIRSYLLLESDVKGMVESPGLYFDSTNAEAENWLDALMLTQGWTRYNAQAILKQNYSRGDRYEVEQVAQIRGMVRLFKSRKTIPNQEVSIVLTGQGQLFTSRDTTDHNGFFSFSCPNFPDSCRGRLEVSVKVGQMYEVVLLPDTFPDVKPLQTTKVWKAPVPTIPNLLDKSRSQWISLNGMPEVVLNEIEIKAKARDLKLQRQEDVRKQFGAVYSYPSYTLEEEQVKLSNTFEDLIYQIPGATANESGAFISQKPIRFYLDEIQMPYSDLITLNVDEIQMMDVVKDIGFSTLMDYDGPIVCIYRKRGNSLEVDKELKISQLNFNPVGYTVPLEFYMPKYNTAENRRNIRSDFRSTVFWYPVGVTDASGKASFNYYTGDGTSPYTVIVEGISTTGKLIHYVGKLNRK